MCTLHVFAGAHGCMFVCVSEMYLYCVYPSLVNVATRCVGSESARVHVLLLWISFTFL